MDIKNNIIELIENFIYELQSVEYYLDSKQKNLCNELIIEKGIIDYDYTILIIGETNSGKSSFVNALLGEKLSPENVNELTGNNIIFRYDQINKIFAELDNNEIINLTENDYISAVKGDNNYSNIKLIFYDSDNEFLKNKRIIDSPGLNSINKIAENKTINVLNTVDLILFVFRAHQLGLNTEKKVIQTLSDMCLNLTAIINKKDLAQNIKKSKETLLNKFGNKFDNIFAVDSTNLIENNDIIQIREYIADLTTNRKLRMEYYIKRLIRTINEMNESCKIKLQNFNKYTEIDINEINFENFMQKKSVENAIQIKRNFLEIENSIIQTFNQFLFNLEKLIDEQFSTYGCISNFFSNSNIDKILKIDFEKLRKLDSYNNEIEKIISEKFNDIINSIKNKFDDVSLDNKKELLNETAIEVATMLLGGKLLKGSKVLNFFKGFLHRINIDNITKKRIFLKTSLREVITSGYLYNLITAVKQNIYINSGFEYNKNEDDKDNRKKMYEVNEIIYKKTQKVARELMEAINDIRKNY